MIPTLSRFIRRFGIRQAFILLSVFCCLLLFGIKIYGAFEYRGRTILIEMRTSVPGIGQIFFDSGKGYNEKESHSYRILTGSAFIQYVIPIPETRIRAIRFDPINAEGSFEIRKITISTHNGEWSVAAEELAKRIIPSHQIKILGTTPLFSGYATGQDPILYVDGLSCPGNQRWGVITGLISCFVLMLLLSLKVYHAEVRQKDLTGPADGVSRNRLVHLALFFFLSLLVMLVVHRGAWVDELRYSPVADGNISRAVHMILSSGSKGLRELTIGDARDAGRIRPAHWINYIPPYLLTMIRNGDLFHSDPKIPWFNRINGDLQTHGIYLLSLLVLAIAFGMSWIRDVTGSWFAALLLPFFISSSPSVWENLLMNYADSQEIPQLFWMMLYIFMLKGLLEGKQGWIAEMISYLALIFAYFTKETSVVLGPVIGLWMGVRLRNDDPSRRPFLFRQLTAHALLFGILLVLVLLFRSGGYVSENLAADPQGLYGRLRFAWFTLTQGLFSPLLFCAGAGMLLLYVLWCYWKRPGRPHGLPLFEVGLPILLCSGLLLVILQWKLLLLKYYLGILFFGSIGTCMLLGMAIHYANRSRRRWILWIVIIGSMFILLEPAGKAYNNIRSLYLDSYGYRKSVPLVAADIARLVEQQQAPVISVHLVLNKLFQEGELPFSRHLNKIEQLNIVRRGRIIQEMHTMERNYFRILPGRRAAEISATDQVTSPLNAQYVYVINRGTSSSDGEGLKRGGFIVEKFWDMGSGCGEIYRYRSVAKKESRGIMQRKGGF